MDSPHSKLSWCKILAKSRMAPFFWFLAPRELLPWKSVIGTVFNGFLALKLVYVLQFMGYYILRRWYYILRQLIGWSHYYILSQVVLHFEPAVYYILRRQVLHFAAGITFCADGITFCGRDYILRRYYILRQYSGEKSSIYTSFTNDYFRKIISRWRLSNHTLKIETQRYTRPKTPREERVCTFCNILEDERHVIFDCPLYHNIRRNYEQILTTNDNITNILNPSYELITDVASLLYDIEKERRNLKLCVWNACGKFVCDVHFLSFVLG